MSNNHIDDSAPPVNAKAYLALIGGIICISFSPIFVKFADTYGDVVTAYRLFIAALGLSVPLILSWKRKQFSLSRIALILGALGGLAFAIDNTLWSISLRFTSAANATLLANTAPIWVGILTWLIFRKELKPLYWLGLLIAIAGTTLIIDPSSLTEINRGEVIALGAGFMYGLYQLATQSARKHIDSMTYTWLFSLVGALLMIGTTQALGHDLFNLSRTSFIALIALGTIGHLGGWFLINYAFGYLSATAVSVTLLLQPVLAGIWAIPLLGELPSPLDLAGGLITLLGIYIVHHVNNSSD